MCDNKPSAKMVALAFPDYKEPEIDKYQKPSNKYYYHCHLDRD